MMHKILIANRGEIAVRVIDTARRMGLATVAVFSEADRNAMHVSHADEAVCIGPPPVSESYLKQDVILEAAARTGADAIHPGYGFLSENPGFAEKCADAGIIFIGPPPRTMEQMGLKDAAKALMEESGVPVVPGYHGDDQTLQRLETVAGRIGYPVLIKAVAGGGGKGMRRVDDPRHFAEALASAQREGKSSFGNGSVLIEKFITRPRHIEVQVFADSQGNAVYLFERDCSIQRRHQKVVEEAPAPDMPLALRQAMGDAAVTAAKAIGYQGAGTIEFIVDVENGLEDAPFYFMEMNTRLQVEHPVTEAITGQDLMEWQIRVARGEPLPRLQSALSIDGHAIEVRLYAEDCDAGFLPSTGTLTRLRFPANRCRVDTGVREGDAVTIHYDPMIAKLITHGPNRKAAIDAMAAALEQTFIEGPTTNRAFLYRIMRHQAFDQAELDTHFIERHAEALGSPKGLTPIKHAALTLAHIKDRANRATKAARESSDPNSPWHARDCWRPNRPAEEFVSFRYDEGELEALVAHPSGQDDVPTYRLTISGETVVGTATFDRDETLNATIDGTPIFAFCHISRGPSDGEDMYVSFADQELRLMLAGPQIDLMSDGGGSDDLVLAPMPGKLIAVDKRVGDMVAKGDRLMILEAMKMEHALHAPADGRIAEMPHGLGDQVVEGTVLASLDLGDA
ncbi:MAG: acetyl/propionyl/methylcrotonyl-CoA carboxylase subunit alpha [Pseudomonadota bacterium]